MRRKQRIQRPLNQRQRESRIKRVHASTLVLCRIANTTTVNAWDQIKVYRDSIRYATSVVKFCNDSTYTYNKMSLLLAYTESMLMLHFPYRYMSDVLQA